MPQVIYTEPSDEIVDLVDKVRTSSDSEVALVIGAATAGLQTPLNVRLLRQLGTGAGKTVSVISGDPYIQELSRVGGLPTYASVPAFERGIQTVRPHPDEGPLAAPAAAAVGGASGLIAPLGPPPPPSRVAAAGTAAAGARSRLAGRRRPLYFVAAGLAIVGLILFLVVAPSAKVTITLAGTQVSANPTIQGSPAPASAGQADHIVTSVVTSDQSAQFTATPTGKQPVATTAATTSLTFVSRFKHSQAYFLVVNPTERFDTADNPPIEFVYNGPQQIQITFPANDGTQYQAGSPVVPVQAATAGARANLVPPNAIDIFPALEDPCAGPNNPDQCKPGDFGFYNASNPTGGTDATTRVVASQNDINGWNAQVTQSDQTLTSQASQDLTTKAAGKTIAKDPGGNGTTIACDVNPALPAANAAFAATQITVACHGKAAVYNPADITADVKADLQQQVAQGDTLVTDAITCTKASVTQAADDGTVVVSIQCTSFSRPAVDLTALKGQLTGHSPADVRNIIQHHLNHVQNVVVKQSPIPFFWLPFFASRIEIDESFVNQTGP